MGDPWAGLSYTVDTETGEFTFSVITDLLLLASAFDKDEDVNFPILSRASRFSKP
jgi:hypothetical protein